MKENEKYVEVMTTQKQNPSQKLAEIITKRLIIEKIISEKDANKLITKIAEGKIKQEDWRMLIENQREKGDVN